MVACTFYWPPIRSGIYVAKRNPAYILLRRACNGATCGGQQYVDVFGAADQTCIVRIAGHHYFDNQCSHIRATLWRIRPSTLLRHFTVDNHGVWILGYKHKDSGVKRLASTDFSDDDREHIYNKKKASSTVIAFHITTQRTITHLSGYQLEQKNE